MGQVLTSWKEIAAYFGKGVRTVQRWERDLGLPIRRSPDNVQNIIFAKPEELDRWLNSLPFASHTAERIKTVLLAESDGAMRAHLQMLFEEAGLLVLSACDAKRAISIFCNGPAVDLLLANAQLADMDGEELASRLTRYNPRLPVILGSRTDGRATSIAQTAIKGKWRVVPIGLSNSTNLLDLAQVMLNGEMQDGLGFHGAAIASLNSSATLPS